MSKISNQQRIASFKIWLEDFKTKNTRQKPKQPKWLKNNDESEY